jgi:hypothetical protein
MQDHDGVVDLSVGVAMRRAERGVMQPKPSDRLAVAEPIVIVDDVRLRRHRWRVAFSRLNLGADGRQQADRDCPEKSQAGPQAFSR